MNLYESGLRPAPAATTTSFDPSRYPATVYPSRSSGIIFGLILGLLGGGSILVGLMDPKLLSFVIYLCGILVAIGLLRVAFAVAYRVTLTADAIDIKQLLSHRQLLRSEIAGRRQVKGEYGTTVHLVPAKTGEKKISFSSSQLKKGTAFADWINTLPDLDAGDRAAAEEQILASSTFGNTTEERKQNLEQARAIATKINGAAALLALWVFLYPTPYGLLVMACALLPLGVLALIHFSQGRYRLNGQRNDAFPNLLPGFIAPAMILALRTLKDVDLLHWQQGLAAAVIGGLILFWFAVFADRDLTTRPKEAWLLLLFCVPWGFGAAVEADRLLDSSTPHSYAVQILDKHISGGRSRTAYVRLTPWGPREKAEDVAVSFDYYHQASVGDTACVHLHHGEIGVAWYEVMPCSPEDPQPAGSAPAL